MFCIYTNEICFGLEKPNATANSIFKLEFFHIVFSFIKKKYSVDKQFQQNSKFNFDWIILNKTKCQALVEINCEQVAIGLHVALICTCFSKSSFAAFHLQVSGQTAFITNCNISIHSAIFQIGHRIRKDQQSPNEVIQNEGFKSKGAFFKGSGHYW